MSNDDNIHGFSHEPPFMFQRNFASHPDLLAPSLVESDETADNLPGPGRNLGRLYDTLGNRLSRFLRENMGKRKTRRMVNEEAPLTQQVASMIANEEAMQPGPSSSPPSRGTDSTASNLPGPGRTVGKLFSWLGKKVERRANNFATQRGVGPEAIALKILRLRCLDDRPLLILSYIDTEEYRRDISDGKNRRKLIKYCRKLFDYARSSISSTQLQALDCITSLAICDTYIRTVLNECLERESFLKNYSYYDSLHDSDALLSRSRRAIVSVTESHIGHLVNRFTLGNDYYSNRTFVTDEFIPQMTRYLRDPDYFFLAIRLLDRLFQTRMTLEGAEVILPLIPKFIAKNCEFVERTATDSCLGHLFEGGDDNDHATSLLVLASSSEKYAFVMDQGTMAILEDLGASLFSNMDKFSIVLKWIIKNTRLDRFIAYFQPPPNSDAIGFNLQEAARIAHICCLLLRAYTSSDHINDHLDVIEQNSKREEIHSRIQLSLLSSTAAIAFCYALHYGEVVRWLSVETGSMEDGDAMQLSSMILVRRTPIDSVLESGLLSACSALVTMLDSDSERVREDAGMYLNFMANIDRFCSFAVSLALTMAKKSTGPSRLLPSGKFTLFAISNGNRFTVYRALRLNTSSSAPSNSKHRRRSEYSLFLSLRSMRRAIRKASRRVEDELLASYHELIATEDCLLWLTRAPGTSFVAAGYHPITVGINLFTNQREYIACVIHPKENAILSTIADGASVFQYRDVEGRERSTTEFFVLALRYEPDYLEAFFPPVPEEVLESESTGPFYWKEIAVEPSPSRVDSHSRRGRKLKKGKQRARIG
ncbi:hypothetical protein SCHPADRAFT_1001338 [Schizopora paradoxa]|uniref:ARM repeat-containing protein n=1 Tax=Schizopora paradoxa TaxID=27342 RepID=A0A0H2R7M9_9AGAM|nr:hypothetical protein SCHPADRAFT_1001338 [Schizopora paradoxa]